MSVRSLVGVAIAQVLAVGAAAAQTGGAATSLHGCTVSGCGGNTPVLFATPIVGLSLRGDASEDGVELVTGRLQRTSPLTCPRVPPLQFDRLRLGIEQRTPREPGVLVGKIGDRVACQTGELKGLVFVLRVPVQCEALPRGVKCPDPIEVRVRIDDIAAGALATWQIDSPPPPLTTYRMVWHALPHDWPPGLTREAREGDSICPLREAWMEKWQIGVDPPGSGQRWHDRTDHLIIVQGETYTRDAAVDDHRIGKDWFNLACVGTAIAKLRLLGYDPVAAQSESGRAERQATLKMLTGRYHGSTSYTSAGMPLMWERSDHKRYHGAPAEDRWRRDLVESYWTADGAICLSHRRTWSAFGAASAPGGGSAADAMRRAIGHAMPEVERPLAPFPAVCRGSGAITAACAGPLEAAYAAHEQQVIREIGIPRCTSAPNDYVWVTYPVDHVAHPAP